MAGISPTGAGVSPAAAGTAMSEVVALDVVELRVKRELWRERASGAPLKSAYHAVARRLGLTPRRVRAYHHNEVDADEVTAMELLAADEAWRREIQALRARIQQLEGLASDEIPAGGPGPVAQGRVDASREAVHRAGGEVAPALDPMARVVTE